MGFQGLRAREVADLQRLQFRGQHDLGAGHEPAGEVVAPGVVVHTLVRKGGQQLFHGAQVRGAGDFAAVVRVAEDEVPEAEVLHEEVMDLGVQGRGVLVDEDRRDMASPLAVGFLRAQVEQRQVRVLRADRLEQGEARLFVHDTVAREAHVGEHAQEVGLVAPVELHGLFVGFRHQDLRPGAHAEDAVLVVDRLLHGGLGLGDDLLVENGQERRVVDGRILHHDDDPHLGPLGVVGHVHAVLEVLDEGQQQVGVALPHVDAVNGLAVGGFVVEHVLPRLVHQQEHRQLREVVLDRAAQHVGVRVVHQRHGDHEVELLAPQGVERLGGCRHPGEHRRPGEVEAAVLVDDTLGEPALLLHDEGLVGAADQQNVGHLARHELVKHLEGQVEVFAAGDQREWGGHGKSPEKCVG